MATLVARPVAKPAEARTLAYDRLRTTASVPLLCGVFLALLGVAWDIQWHVDVGPDTFFTAPHLVLYTGIAIAGLTALTVVLLTTFRYRGAADETISVLWGLFRGPVGFIIAGVGALLFLAYGLLDQWWHVIYGFDVTLVSPPHVGLVLSILITMIGCLSIFGAEVRRAPASGRGWLGPSLGFALAVAMLFAMITPTTVDLIADVAGSFGLPRGHQGPYAFLYSLMLLMTASALRRPGAATLAAFMLTVLRLGLWFAVPWITAEYATAVGLFLRDNTTGAPVVPGMLPPYLLLAGVAVDLGLLAGRRLGWNVRLTVLLAGALVPIALQLLTPAPSLYVAPHSPFPIRPDLFSLDTLAGISVVPMAVGAIGGMLGWSLGFVVRNQDAPAGAAEAVQPAAVEIA